MATAKLHKDIEATFKAREDIKGAFLGKGESEGKWFFGKLQATRCFEEGFDFVKNPNYKAPEAAKKGGK